jgi:cysteine desulfurase
MIYLDYQATTPVAPEVAAAMRPWIEEKFANPHSPSKWGREAAAAIEMARGHILRALIKPTGFEREDYGNHSADTLDKQDVARWIDSNQGPFRSFDEGSGRLFFTSGATEAANWALKGTWHRLKHQRRKIVSVATEHACVLDTLAELADDGAELVILPVDAEGRIRHRDVIEAIDENTALVACMSVNNEIGVVQPINFVGEVAHRTGAVMFCDAVQGFLRWHVPIGSCDLVAISSHKIHGPKGIGALWVRNGFEPHPLIHGGGQEMGIRSGTLSPALCVGFGAAAQLGDQLRAQDAAHVQALWHIAREMFRAPEWALNGMRQARYHGNLNVRRDGTDAARLLSDCREIAFSLGSACASGSGRPSHVLRALGLKDQQARSSIRIGFGRYTTEDELRRACQMINEAAHAQSALPA